MVNQFEVIVQKYGGSSVADAQKIKSVAKFIHAALTDNRRICVVVSAMGHTTNELIELAHQICPDPPKRELDMLISCGERSSMALLAMALFDIGVKAVSLTGSQSGIITDDNHSGAEIIAIKPSRVLEALQSNQVVIIAGFQGVSEKKEITTLRRGGSDTTAVGMAAALNAQYCEIYTDVAGVMDVDPKIVKQARVLDKLTFDQMEGMALYGAKVLAHDAIRLAKELGVSLQIRKVGEASPGSQIQKDIQVSGQSKVVAITHLRALVQINVDLDHMEKLSNEAGYFLCGSQQKDQFVAYISNDIAQELVGLDETKVNAGLALMTVHLRKNQDAFFTLGIIIKLFKDRGLVLENIIIGRNEIFVIVPDNELEEKLNILHKGLSMSGDDL